MDGNPLQECDHGAILLSVMRYHLGEKKTTSAYGEEKDRCLWNNIVLAELEV